MMGGWQETGTPVAGGSLGWVSDVAMPGPARPLVGNETQKTVKHVFTDVHLRMFSSDLFLSSQGKPFGCPPVGAGYSTYGVSQQWTLVTVKMRVALCL